MKNRFQISILLIIISITSIDLFGSSNQISKEKFEIEKVKMDKFVTELINKMTLEEKIGQLNQVTGNRANTGPIDPLSSKGDEIKEGKIGSILNSWGVDIIERYQRIAVEESRLHIPIIFGLDVIHGLKTIFPIPLAQAASWDLKSIENAERIAAKEASATGVCWTFSPMVDISRDARWGRVAESSGEDTYMATQIAMARIRGFQGDDLKNKYSIAACCKHFAAYGAAVAGRDYNTVDMSLQVLHDVYLPPFKAASDNGVATFMSSFNSLNGVPATANKYLMKETLKNKWNFKGFIVSDAHSVSELINHGFAQDRAEAGKLALNAGLDMDMGSGIYIGELSNLVKKGIIQIKDIDDAVRNVLNIKYKLGLFENPYKYCDKNREKTDLLSPEHRDAARDLARKSIVLLKNDKNILPLSKNIGRIAVIGPLAKSKKDMLGCWSVTGDSSDVISIYVGIKASVSPSSKVLYHKGCEIDSKIPENFDSAIELAKTVDVIILAVGESGDMSGEARSRTNINIPGNQEELVIQMSKLGKPIVVLLSNGRPLTIPKLNENVSTIVETWFLGTEAGHAIADVLFGDYNPSGKLTVSFPASIGQVPLFYNEYSTGRPSNGNQHKKYRSRYTDCTNEALFPFGYGLSYTTFKYSNLKLNKNTFKNTDSLEISIDVQNTGSRNGEEIVQLYIRDLFASIVQPIKVLKKYEKISLQPLETKTVTFKLKIDDLKFHDINLNWIAEPGDFDVFVGGNSKELLQSRFTLL